MNIPFFTAEFMNKSVKTDLKEAFEEVLKENRFSGGNQLVDFETAFAKYTGFSNFLACSNGTDAIEIMLRVWGVGPGDEVILPALTCYASMEPVLQLGATPVFVDVEEESLTIDPTEVRKIITPKTKVIIPVHLYGHFAEVESLMEIVAGTKIKVLEDCAQAHGLFHNGRHAGSFGDGAAFSFYPTKNLGALGEAGGLFLKNEEEFETAFKMRNHGQAQKDQHQFPGRNARMDTIQAAFLLKKLPFLNGWNSERSKIANRYLEKLQNVEFVKQDNSVWHQFIVKSRKRDQLAQFLKNNGVGTAIHYPYLISVLAGSTKNFPVAETAKTQILSLPVYPGLTTDQQDYIIDLINSFTKVL